MIDLIIEYALDILTLRLSDLGLIPKRLAFSWEVVAINTKCDLRNLFQKNLC